MSNISIASNDNMKVLKAMLYLLKQIYVNYSHLTTRFTALYQPNWAEKTERKISSYMPRFSVKKTYSYY